MLATVISLLFNMLALVGYWEDAGVKAQEAQEAPSTRVERLDLVAFSIVRTA
jgi:hypothetical protein